ncbi:MAG TPA: hypothetical protein VFV75_11230 [Candidatus Polarisedimenticolaceae bacterium]|nr:hypothetical protein [Candidatus Polarisedimenticolaceae bacterium]
MTWTEKVLLWSSTLAVGVTGLVYAWMKYLLPPVDPYSAIHHPLQPLVLKVHLVAAPFLVFAVGLVFTQHIWGQFRAGLRRGRRSGIGTLLTLVPMVLSGHLIQTVTAESWLFSLAMIHLFTGSLFVLGFTSHQASMWMRQVRARRRAAAFPGDRDRQPPRAAPPA